MANASTKLVGAFYHISNVEVGSDAEVVIDIGCELQEACDWTLEISKQGDSECSDLGFVEIAIIGEVTSEYVISWNHTKERTLTLDALSKGTYTLTITDGDCEKSIDVIINDTNVQRKVGGKEWIEFRGDRRTITVKKAKAVTLSPANTKTNQGKSIRSA